MTLAEIERQLNTDPAPLLRDAGMPSDAAMLPRRVRRAMAYYRRALTYAPLTALQDEDRDHRFDPFLTRNMTMPPAKVDRMCEAYEKRAQRQHCRALARTVASRLKSKEDR